MYTIIKHPPPPHPPKKKKNLNNLIDVRYNKQYIKQDHPTCLKVYYYRLAAVCMK